MSFYLELKQAILRQYFRRSYSFQRLPVGQRLVLIVLPMISLFGLLVMLFSSPTAPPISTEISDRPVHVDFFVMSKCPDARLCETLFIPSLLKLSPIVNFTLSFIAYRNRKNEISCMHGPDECLGNEQQLCVQHLYSQKIFLQFLQCQTRRIDAIPSNGEECAKELGAQGVEWSKIDACVKSSGAKELFAQALERTRLAQAKKSCTIHLNGKFWCMHDGDWYACSDGHDEKSFLQAICSRYNGTNKPHECDHLN